MARVAKAGSSARAQVDPLDLVRAASAKLVPVNSIRHLQGHCRTCSVHQFCLPHGLTGDEVNQFDELIAHRIKLRKNAFLYRAGEAFHALYAIQYGSLKTVVLAEDGRELVTGYHMLGEIVGFEGIGTDCHGASAITLEDTEVCLLPFGRIENLARNIPALQHNLHQLISREITHYQTLMLVLGSMHAEERLAVFLLNLADRYRRRGYSSTEYLLRMTREEIGSYLGLKLETVSRLFSRFHGEGLIHVEGRAVTLLDPVRLKRIVGQNGRHVVA